MKQLNFFLISLFKQGYTPYLIAYDTKRNFWITKINALADEFDGQKVYTDKKVK